MYMDMYIWKISKEMLEILEFLFAIGILDLN